MSDLEKCGRGEEERHLMLRSGHSAVQKFLAGHSLTWIISARAVISLVRHVGINWRFSLFIVSKFSVAICIASHNRIRAIDVPLPNYRLASTALRALQVDVELSPLVRRSFSLVSSGSESQVLNGDRSDPHTELGETQDEDQKTILRTKYRATTNRMLRVAVNGFMESVGVVLGVMAELDADVLSTPQDSERSLS